MEKKRRLEEMSGKAEQGDFSGSSAELLYVDDSYLREFDATVVRTGPGYVLLNRTAFYPKSGGQPSDTGLLQQGTRQARVLKVLKRGRDIFHYIDGTMSEGLVRGIIDWDARFHNMRRHSAEHLLTGLFERMDAGPKVYSDLEHLEFRPSEITEDDVRHVEAEFNEAVRADVNLKIYYAARRELEVGDDERKRSFLEKIPKNVERLRMVEIPGCSLTFCFGTHVRSTGEIGLLRELKLSKGKKGRRIVEFTLE